MNYDIKIVAGTCEINGYDNLKQELEQELVFYKNLVLTEENLAFGKKKRAELNTLIKTINDRRLALEREYISPFTLNVKEPTNGLLDIIKNVVATIDNQAKAFEQKEKDTKKQEVFELFQKHELQNYLSFDSIFQDSYLNKTITLAKISDDFDSKVSKIKDDLNTLDYLVKEPTQNQIAKQEYLKTFDLKLAVAEIEKINERLRVVNRPIENATVEPTETSTETTIKSPTSDFPKIDVILSMSIDKNEWSAIRQFLSANDIKYTIKGKEEKENGI